MHRPVMWDSGVFVKWNKIMTAIFLRSFKKLPSKQSGNFFIYRMIISVPAEAWYSKPLHEDSLQ